MLADCLAMCPPMSIRVQSVVDLNELLLSMLGMLRYSFGERIALSTILAGAWGSRSGSERHAKGHPPRCWQLP